MSRLNPEDWTPEPGIVLDERTLAAVRKEVSTAIVAGPGAGKTELLAQRASFLLQTGICPPPRRILAISFKRDAAKNLRDRVSARVGKEYGARLDSYTFDAFAKGIVDRFSSALPQWCRPTRNYDVAFPGYRDWAEFAGRLQTERQLSFNGQQLEKIHAYLGTTPGPLPAERPSRANQRDMAALLWWTAQLRAQPSRLTFGMISTLAVTILEHNPLILGALRQTYSHVFLDEFQDTTALQYEVLRQSFAGSGAVMTAVGDTKQRIMTWAGAVPDAFEWFIRDFEAGLLRLAVNFRSNERIVQIVNGMASTLEADAVAVAAARAADPLPTYTDGILHYSSPQQEAASLAKWMADEIAEGQRRAEDYLLLIRQRADAVEPPLREAFAGHGLSIRNEARAVAGVAIQELITEPLGELLVAVLQMGIDDRTDAPFQRARSLLEPVYGVADERPEPQLRLEDSIRQSVGAARAAAASPPSQSDIEALCEAIFGAFGEVPLRQLSPDYEKPERYQAIRTAVCAFLKESAGGARDWQGVVGSYLGRSQIRLMTVHKSKGLEAHTVIFLHLQDNAFNARADIDEELLMFFVAVSRARERLFITTTSQQRSLVAPLWQMLEDSGVKPLVS